MTIEPELLTPRIRELMLHEVESDLREGCLHMSRWLTPTGVHSGYSRALREAIEHGTDHTLAAALVRDGLVKWKELHRGKNGQPFVRSVPRHVSTSLAREEFSRFYLRAVRAHQSDASHEDQSLG